jgi:hypothetical protein
MVEEGEYAGNSISRMTVEQWGVKERDGGVSLRYIASMFGIVTVYP